MQNRRELLVNLVELKITSNVSSVIQFKVGGSTQSFTGTSASIKVEQGKTVEWSVSADGYVSQSGSEVMKNNKDMNVSLALDTVQFTINTNVDASITINGNTSTGVTSKSITVNRGSNVNWSVSASGYFSQSGSEGALTNDKAISVSLVSGVTSTCTTGYIWCTDGSFVAPEVYQSSGKTAYGYTLSNTTVVSITKSDSYMSWASTNSRLYDRNLTGASSLTDGVANSNYLKSYSGYSSSACPAIYYGCTQVNAGKTSYMPAIDELYPLNRSIMTGSMKTDLTTAGLYESCNYRLPDSYDDDNSGEWEEIWSSTQAIYKSNDYRYAYYMWDNGKSNLNFKSSSGAVIPFFNFS